MIYRIYDRYEGSTISVLDIDVTPEQLDKLKKEFGQYLQKKLEQNEADDDLSEFCNFLESKQIKVTDCEYAEVDL